MVTHVRRTLVLLAAVMVIGPMVPTAASGQDTGSTAGCALPDVDDRCERWVTVYQHPEPEARDSYQFPVDAVVGPDGQMFAVAYRTSDLFTTEGASRWTLLALEADTGAVTWETRYGDPARRNVPTAMAIAPDGDTVYVTGHSRSDFSAGDTRTVTAAFDAADGDRLWTNVYSGPGGQDHGIDVGAGPDGRHVYVAASSRSGGSQPSTDIVVLALDAATGDQRFQARYGGVTDDGDDIPMGLAVAPDGSRVYVAGTSAGPGRFNRDYVSLAVDTSCPGWRRDGPPGDSRAGDGGGPPPAACGPEVGGITWVSRYDGLGARAPDRVGAMALGEAGSVLYVTGNSHTDDDGPPFSGSLEFATVAYRADTGQQLWERRRGWQGYDDGFPNAVAAAGGRVAITGQISQRGGEVHAGTVAYDTAGGEVWADRLETTGHDYELTFGAAASPGGDTFYVTGLSANTTTSVAFAGGSEVADQISLAYDAADGTRRWVARHNATGYGRDKGQKVLAGSDGERVYTLGQVTRNVEADGNFYDTSVIAYDVPATEDLAVQDTVGPLGSRTLSVRQEIGAPVSK